MQELIKEILLQEARRKKRKKKAGDRCTRIAKRKYDVWPSAYASGAVVKCRQGKIWKNENLEYDLDTLTENQEYENLIKEGWKENILAAITLAAGVGLNTPAKASSINSIVKIENSIVSEEQKFFAACLQFCQELKNSDLSFDQRKSLTEAELYFQSKRDNVTPKKLTEAAAVTVKSVESTVMQMTGEEINMLTQKGLSAKVNAEIMDHDNYTQHFQEDIYNSLSIIKEVLLDEARKKKKKKDFSFEKNRGLRGWFDRQGGSGKSKGWVDCNTCRTNKKTGRKKCKSCGRQSGEKRSKYPRCRPTPSQCKGYKRPDQR